MKVVQTIPGETEGPPFQFFRHCETSFRKTFFSKAPLQRFRCFATEWML